MSEPWIRVHANVAAKPVVWRAVEALGVSQHEAIGLLVQFWGSVSQHATNGKVRELPDAQIEVWAGWTKKRGRFAKFIRDKHLDDSGRVNEWDEYAGALEEQRRQSRARKRKSRGSHSDGHTNTDRDSHSDKAVTVTPMSHESSRTSSPTKRNETIRYETIVDVNNNNNNQASSVPIASTADLPASTFVAVCINRAIAEQWGEQPTPITPGNVAALVQSLADTGVPGEIARLSIYRQCRESKLRCPPKSANYFRPGIEADWEAEQTRCTLATSGEVPPASVASIPFAAELAKWAADTEAKEAAERQREQGNDTDERRAS